MYYEIYIDSLFLLNFTLNLYVLLLVNKSLHCAATRRRLLLGAIAGGAGYCLMFILPFRGVLLKIILVGLGLNGAVIYAVFRPHSLGAFFKVLETMFVYALFIGGAFLLMSNHIKAVREHGMPVVGVLAVGGLAWLFLTFLYEKKKANQNAFCRVWILGKDNKKTSVLAVVDTGNGLVEPISGKPVSVLDKQVYEACFGKADFFRAIPYRSVGCERGIMEGVQVAELHIEIDGICKICSDVCVGLSERPVSSGGTYQMLLHPKMLE